MSTSKADRPTQRTPQGTEIPVPKRSEFLRNLQRISGAHPDAAVKKGSSTPSPRGEGA